MAAITPIVRTHVSNVTRTDVKYGWYPPHGLYVPARGCVVVDGDVMSLCTKDTFKQLLLNDLSNRRVKLSLEVIAQKGVSLRAGDKTVAPKIPKVKPVEKPEVKKAQQEADLNEEAIINKLAKLETGEEPVEPFSETFKNKTIEEMKPPITNMFGDDWEKQSSKKADVETVDMFGADAFGDKADTVADKARAVAAEKVAAVAAETEAKAAAVEAVAAAKDKKAASIAKGLATRKANAAKKAAALAADKFGDME